MTEPAENAEKPTAEAVPDRPRLSTGRKALFTAVLCAAALLAAEATLRVYYRARTGSWEMPDKYRLWQRLYVPHPYLGWQVAPSMRHEQDGRVVETNALGFRGPEVELPKPPGRLRIATLGGSTTFNTRVSANDRTWTARLAARARARGLDVDYVNGGCPNYTTADSLNNLALRVLDTDPDLIIVYHTWNDLRPAQEPGFRADYAHWRPIPEDDEPGLLRRALRHSLIYLKLERELVREAAREELLSEAAAPEKLPMPEAAPAAFERNLRSIVAICRANGIEVALSTFATRSSPHEEAAEEDFGSYYLPHFDDETIQAGLLAYAEVVREVATDTGVALIDAQKHMPFERDRPEARLYDDAIHFTDEGADVMAGVMDAELARQGVWRALAARAEKATAHRQ